MVILLMATAFNSLTQRVFAELRDLGHRVEVAVATDDEVLRAAVDRHQPELIVAPFLTTAIPRDIWSTRICLIVHPGPVGDRGPSSLDRAVQDGVREWGVTVLQAEEEMDAGPIWASVDFPVPEVAKSDLYRNEVADAASTAVRSAVERFAAGDYQPRAQDAPDVRRAVRTRPPLRQDARRIDWAADSTATVLRKLRAADSQPGVRDELLGAEWFLCGGHPEPGLSGGTPGQLLATRAGAVCRATTDGAVWIPQLRPPRPRGGPRTFALPATQALGDRLPPLPELPAPPDGAQRRDVWGDIRYRESGTVGMLSFSFPGGAMSTEQCRRLLTAYRAALTRPTSVLVLGGQRDLFSHGIHLKVIHAAADPATESWENLQAMNDLVEAVLTTTDRLTVAALGGNAAAGGVMLALAADEVWCRTGALLNPHYRLMGLYGSEYWTYSLPRRVGRQTADRLMADALPMTSAEAVRLGLAERQLHCTAEEFTSHVAQLSAHLADSPRAHTRIAAKKAEHELREARTPLAAYRERELARMHAIFFNPRHPYHALREAFVHKSTHKSAQEPAQEPVPEGRPSPP